MLSLLIRQDMVKLFITLMFAICFCAIVDAGDCYYRIADTERRNLTSICSDTEFYHIRSYLRRDEFINFNSITELQMPDDSGFPKSLTSKAIYTVTSIRMVFTHNFKPSHNGSLLDQMNARSNFQDIHHLSVYSQTDALKPYVLANLQYFDQVNELHFHGFSLNAQDMDLVCNLPALKTLVLTASPEHSGNHPQNPRKRRRSEDSTTYLKSNINDDLGINKSSSSVDIRYIDGSEIQKVLENTGPDHIRARAYRTRATGFKITEINHHTSPGGVRKTLRYHGVKSLILSCSIAITRKRIRSTARLGNNSLASIKASLKQFHWSFRSVLSMIRSPTSPIHRTTTFSRDSDTSSSESLRRTVSCPAGSLFKFLRFSSFAKCWRSCNASSLASLQKALVIL